ncbi:MAG: flagellar biosynthesis repressor FlbT [Devosia sp.]|nr:flagellar biosynthesis repressor FlbT [Devosia sp.]
MTLKLTLKPGEPLFIGETEIRIISSGNCTVIIEGDAPILRAQYALPNPAGTDPISRLQIVLQGMYLSRNVEERRDEYMAVVVDLLTAYPEHADWVRQTNKSVIAGDIYQAVRSARQLALQQGASPAGVKSDRLQA